MGAMSEFSYQPRPVTFLDLWEHRGWRMKLYGIAYGRSRPEASLVQRAGELAAEILPEASEEYGVGFIGAHQGKAGNFIFVDWWADENELHHHVFISKDGAPEDFVDATATGPTACVWDLAVIHYERNAWIETVMKRAGEEAFDAYLERRLEGTI